MDNEYEEDEDQDDYGNDDNASGELEGILLLHYYNKNKYSSSQFS